MIKKAFLILLYFLFINFSHAEEILICNTKKENCYKAEAVSYNYVKFVKYNHMTDRMIMKYKHSIINLKISNLNLTNVKSKDIKEKNQALVERNTIIKLLSEARRIDLKRCVFVGYYSCEVVIDDKLLTKF